MIFSAFVSKLRAIPKTVLREWLLLAAFLCVLGGVMSSRQSLAPLDAIWFDAIIASKPLSVPTDIAIITIDPDTLDRRDLSRRMWSKSDSAELLEIITRASPQAVLMDIQMPVSDPREPVGETSLSAAIKKSGKVVLPIYLQNERGAIQGFRLPMPHLANFAAALGHDKTVNTADGQTRRIPLSITNNEIDWPHVIVATLTVAEGAPPKNLPAAVESPAVAASSAVTSSWREDQNLYLRFISPNASFDSYTARQMLNGEISSAKLQGKIVLIGSSQSEFGTLSRSGSTMLRLELFANAINTIRQDAWPTAISSRLAAPITVCLILLALVFFLALTDRFTFGMSLAAILGVTFAAWALLYFAGVWFPIAAFAVTIAVAYPLWAWRRLSATYKFVSLELNRMRAEPGVLSAAVTPTPTKGSPAPLLDQQLAAIEEATNKLRAARSFVTRILEGLPSGVIVSDAKGIIIFANGYANAIANAPLNGANGSNEQNDNTRLQGQALDDVLAKFSSAEKLTSGAQTAPANTLGWQNRTRAINYSCEITDQHGNQHWLVCQQISDDTGATVGTIITITDISALRESEEHREELLGFLSHDMRSPLASIMALIELRSESMTESTDNQRFIEVKRYAGHTLSLAEEFLQLAFATSSKPNEFATIDLVMAVENGADLVRPLARERQVKLAFTFPEVAALRGNHNLISRLFANLVHNAIKFSPSHGTIFISIERIENNWLCVVRDEGSGIAENQLERLFEPYRRLKRLRASSGLSERTEPSNTPKERIGLGLKFVKVVVEKHGGVLDIAAMAGRGTVVSITLPATI